MNRLRKMFDEAKAPFSKNLLQSYVFTTLYGLDFLHQVGVVHTGLSQCLGTWKRVSQEAS